MPPTPDSRRHRAGLLAVAAALLLFANGRNTVAAAAWLAPVFLLRFTRLGRARSALSIAGVVLFLTWLFQFRGMVPLPLAGMLGVALLYALFGLLPYAIDRWLCRQSSGFSSSLVFPCAVAAVEFSVASLCPYGSWGAVGYSQYGNLALMQLSAVTGLYGISFLVSWLGAVINWAWARNFLWASIRRGVVIFIVVVAGVFVAGAVRIAVSAPRVEYVRVAGVAANDDRIFPDGDAGWRFLTNQPLTREESTFVQTAMTRSNENLFAKSEREAQAGARLVVWNEGAGQVRRSDEPALMVKAADLARRNRIYLGIALLSYDPGQPKPIQNKVELFGPDGRLLYEYWKARPVPGAEAATTQTNGNPVCHADTPFGRIGAFICFDLDFPSLVRRAGRDHADMVIAPSSDWLAIDPWHTRMASFRAVENGFNLIRTVGHGRSMATDYLGRPVAETDYFTNADHTMVGYLPTRGTATPYAQIGDLFSWLCVGALALQLFANGRMSRKRLS